MDELLNLLRKNREKVHQNEPTAILVEKMRIFKFYVIR